MLDPRLIDFHLTKVQRKIGEDSTLANTYFRLVKPIEENLKVYSNLNKQGIGSFTLKLFAAPFKIFLEISKSLGIAALKFRESAGFKVPQGFQNQRVFVSHYTHAQVSFQPDVFFDQLPRKNDLIFYHNNTLLNRTKILKNLDKSEFRQNVAVTTKSLGIRQTFLLQISNLLVSFRLLAAALRLGRFTNLEREILINASIAQVSRKTLANQINLKRLDSVLNLNNPSSLIITLEGHSYESSYIDLVHNSYPNIQLMAFQHAPIVPDQFGLIRNLLKLNSNDVILASGEITKSYFSSLGLKASIRLLGSPKWRPLAPNQKVRFPITLLGAAEGTIESLESFTQLFEDLSSLGIELKLILRVHPSLSAKESTRILSRYNLEGNFTVSSQKLEQDLIESHFCVYRSSAVAIEGLRYGVIPLYFNPNGDQGLNPLYFAGLELPVFRNLQDFRELFQNLGEMNLGAARNQHEELLKVGAAYYNKLDSSALNRL
jgi:hypothetical protein